MRLGAPLRVVSSTASMIDIAGGTGGDIDRSIANVSLGAIDGAGASAGTGAGAAINNGGNVVNIAVGNDSGNSTGDGHHTTPGYRYWQREYQKCCVVRQAKDMKQATLPLIYISLLK